MPKLKNGFAIIGGDFNAARQYDVVHKKNAYRWFFDELAERGYYDCHFGLHGKEVQSFWGHQAKHPYQLDHFYIPIEHAPRVRACTIIDNADTRRFSDHGPIVLAGC